ncbi:MAG: M48 family metalloprotease [Methylophilaceae bacterium]|jgi:predicted Zn-dependent protease
MIKHSLLLAVLLASAPAQALDLGGVLKDALDKKQEEISAPAQADNPSQAENPSPDKSEPTINLKKPSRAEEIQVGREIAGNILGAAPLVKDPALQKYVNQVGRWVASQSERPYLPWHFGVIESEDLNAFAAPGGYVLITKGLYRQLKNESELAGVLGHEIGHVIKKHQLKLLQKQQLLSMGAGLLSGKLGKENPTVQKVVGSGAEISARSLDKSAEYEADRIGVVLAGRAGYEPFGLPEVLQTIGHAGKDDGRVALLFKTHPHPDDRLTALGDAIGSRLDKVEGKTLENRFYKLKN